MSNLKKKTALTKKQKDILNLEKKYFKLLHKIFTSKEFTDDLLDIEDYLQDEHNYQRIQKLHDKKNKIDIALERIMRKNIYNSQKKLGMVKVYPSPVSADIAFVTKDAIINLDSKTTDYVGNKGDWDQLEFEKNQSSFDNKFPGKSKFFRGCDIACSLPKDEDDIPLLTFFLGLLYKDNNKTFELCREEGYKNLHFTCLPNGHLSELFSNNIVINCKDYKYEKNGAELITLSTKGKKKVSTKEMKNKDIKNLAKSSFKSFKEFKKEAMRAGFIFPNKIKPIKVFSRHGFVDTKSKKAWVPCNEGSKIKVNVFRSLLSGSTLRAGFDKLANRYDSKNKTWVGHREWSI